MSMSYTCVSEEFRPIQILSQSEGVESRSQEQQLGPEILRVQATPEIQEPQKPCIELREAVTQVTHSAYSED